MVIKISKENESSITKKDMYAVKNPNGKNKSWFYNIFLGGLLKEKPNHNKVKVNWLMELTESEANTLKEINCDIYPINSDIKMKDINNNKDFTNIIQGFNSLYKLFNKTMSDVSIRSKIRVYLTKKGKPSKSYEKITKAKESLDNLQNLISNLILEDDD